MLALLAIGIILGSTLLAIAWPWIGVVAYYAMAIGQPQDFWPVEFAGSRFSLYLTAGTALGVAIATARRQLDYRVLYQPQNLLVALLVIWVNLAHHFSTFNTLADPVALLGSEFVLEYFNKVIFFYFLAVLVIDTRQKLLCLLYMIAGIGILHTLWANKVYVTGEFWRFGDNGRLSGPFGMIQDENFFAILFVLVTPILYYLGYMQKHIALKFAFWIPILFAWHGLFLTGSRGGVLALVMVCAYIAWRSYSKVISAGFLVALALAITLQGGQLVNRVESTIETSQVETFEQREEAIDPRLVSWQVGTRMIKDRPVFGVGVANFQNAFYLYSDKLPLVAHNTFFQFAANCGLLAGLIFLSFFVMRGAWYVKTMRNRMAAKTFQDPALNYIDDTLNAFMLGLFIVSMLLDTMIYEYLYLLLVMILCKYNLDKKESLSTVAYDATKNEEEHRPPPAKPRSANSIYS